MDTPKEKKRWPLTLVIIAAVVIASAALIYSYRDAPGRIPVSAINDGSNGVIVAWQNSQGIYAQRVDSSGQIKWEKGGVFIGECPPGSGFSLIPDSPGGAIITWSNTSSRPADRDDPAYFDPVPFYSQRISAGGELLWSDTPISTGEKWQVIPDGAGGTIFAWNNYETYYRALHDDFLRLQKIAPDGRRRLWGNEGVLVVASSPYHPLTEEEIASGIKGTITRSRPTYEGTHYVVTDGAGGVIALWEEEIGSGEKRVYAQRLDSQGKYAWPDRVTTAATELISAESDGEGGARIETSEATASSAGTVRVWAHINGDGEVLPTSEWEAGIIRTISDGLGGSFSIRVAEYTTYPPRVVHYTHYIQRLDASGQALWPKQRIFSVDSPPNSQFEYLADGTGGLIITYQLQKDFLPYSVMALRLDASGSLGWGEQGIPVFDTPGIKYQANAATFSDSSGGAIVVALLGRGGLSGDMVYAQRLDINGNRLWGDGVRIDR